MIDIDFSKHYKIAFDNAPAIMMVLNEKQEIQLMNKTGLDFVMATAEQVKTKKCGDIFNCINAIKGRGKSCKGCNIANTIEKTVESTKSIKQVEAKLVSFKDDKEVTLDFLVSSIVLKNDGQSLLLVTLENITELKQHQLNELKAEKEKINIEKQLFHSSKLATIGELAASIGHEINNPLAIIFGTLDVLKLRNAEEIDTILPQLDTIIGSAIRIQNIVSGLKTFARVDEETVGALDLHQLIIQSLTLIESIYEKESVKIVKEFKAKSSLIKANEGRVQQVIMNLLSNARDALQSSKGGTITVESSNFDNYIRIKVIDSGPGISKEHINKIFDNFFTTKPVGHGTGLGLPISYKIIREMEGALTVESEDGVGATFIVDIPLYQGKLLDNEDDCKKVILSDLTGRALIVDDEKTLRSILCNIVSKFGLEYDQAGDGTEAISYLENSNYDYLITDIKMPKMGGYELIKEVRRKKLVKKVIAISGGMTKSEEDAIIQISDAVIHKPFRSSDIYKILKDLK